MLAHKVTAGECLSSIAAQHGFDWKIVWDDGANADLRRARKDPNVLHPGDIVHIPAFQLKQEVRPTNQSHRFRVKGSQTRFRVRLMQLGEPRANVRCTVDIDGRPVEKSTDGDGRLEVLIAPSAQRALLTVHGEHGDETYTIDLGHLDPADSPSGVRQRLTNLGYAAGAWEEDGGQSLRQALSRFQMDNKLEITGDLDGATKSKLIEAHGG